MGTFTLLRWRNVKSLLRLQRALQIFLGSFNNVDELIEQMKDHQWVFSGITRPKFKKHIGKDDVRFDYGAVDCYYLATKSTCREPR